MIVLEEKLYTSDETAEVIGVTARTLYRYVKNGEITPETKTKSGTYRFLREEIYKYLYPSNFKEIIEQVKMVEQESTKYSSSGNGAITTPLQTQAPSVDQQIPAQSSTNITQPNTTVGDDVDSVPPPSNIKEGPAPAINTVNLDQKEPQIDLEKELKDLENNLSDSGPNKKEIDPSSASLESPTQDYPNDKNPTPDLKNPSQVSDLSSKSSQDISTLSGGNVDTSFKNGSSSTNLVSGGNDSSREDSWNYYLSENMGLLDIAKKINELSKETGRKYAATMHGGMSLHRDIDEFFTIHFYIEAEDLNWWVEQLDLKSSEESKANICLIPSESPDIFRDAYKLRGLFVVSDQKLIEDLMKHGEKELAKSLI